MDENGHYLGEEYSVCMASDFILKKHPKGTVVVNASTTQAIEDIAKKHKSKLIRTKVGEVYVAEKMMQEKAIIGGEGNGGIIYPKVHYVRDSLVGITLMLQYMAETNKSISELSKEIPKYYMTKEKVSCTYKDAYKVLNILKEKYENENLDLIDGLTISKNDLRINIRPSNTEPILKLIVEAISSKLMKQKIRELSSLISN